MCIPKVILRFHIADIIPLHVGHASVRPAPVFGVHVFRPSPNVGMLVFCHNHITFAGGAQAHHLIDVNSAAKSYKKHDNAVLELL